MSAASGMPEMPLGRGSVRAWFCATESLAPDLMDRLTIVLSADERRRRDRFVFPEDRRDFAAAHGLVRRVLSRYGTAAPCDWRFETGASGKPAVNAAQAGEPPLSFSLSHTRGLVACVVGAGIDVGIDVERVDRAAASLDAAARYFAPCEIEMLDACADAERPIRFVELWTLKEAYVKALGLGLGCPLHSFSFSFEGDSNLAFHTCPASAASRWRFALAAPAPGYRLSVAASAPSSCGGELIIRDATALETHPILPRRQSAMETCGTPRVDLGTLDPAVAVPAKQVRNILKEIHAR